MLQEWSPCGSSPWAGSCTATPASRCPTRTSSTPWWASSLLWGWGCSSSTSAHAGPLWWSPSARSSWWSSSSLPSPSACTPTSTCYAWCLCRWEREILPVWGECLVRLVVLCQWLQMVHGGRVGRDSSVVECQTGDQKVAGLRRNGRIFLSSISFLCWLLFQYPFHSCVTGIARKRPWSFHQEGRWQLTCVCGAIDPQKHWQLVHNSLVTCLWSRTYTKTLTMTPQLLSNVFVERDIYSYIDNDSTRTTP